MRYVDVNVVPEASTDTGSATPETAGSAVSSPRRLSRATAASTPTRPASGPTRRSSRRRSTGSRQYWRAIHQRRGAASARPAAHDLCQAGSRHPAWQTHEMPLTLLEHVPVGADADAVVPRLRRVGGRSGPHALPRAGRGDHRDRVGLERHPVDADRHRQVARRGRGARGVRSPAAAAPTTPRRSRRS